MQALHQAMQAQHGTLLAEVAARDARIQQLSQEGSHAQQALHGTVQQMQALLASHKLESEQVPCCFRRMFLRVLSLVVRVPAVPRDCRCAASSAARFSA